MVVVVVVVVLVVVVLIAKGAEKQLYPSQTGAKSGSLQQMSREPGHIRSVASSTANSGSSLPPPNLISISPAPSVMIWPPSHW